MMGQGERPVRLEVRRLEGVPDLVGGDLGAAPLDHLLDHGGELDLQAARQVEAVLELHDVGHAALAGLAVDADHRLVAPAHVMRVDGQVRHLPDVVVLAERLEALLDRVLVGTGEGGVDQVTHVGVPRVHRQAVAVLGDAPGRVDVGEVELRVHPLAEQVEREGDHVHVAGALAVAEERALHAVRPRLHGQLGGGHRGAAVVVRVERQHDGIPPAYVAQEPLDLIGVHVGGRHLDGGGQVQDHRPGRSRLPHVHDPLADLHREVELGAGEALRGVLVVHVAFGNGRGQLAAVTGRAHRDVHDAGPVEAEHHPALERGGGVVEVHHRPRGPAERLVGALDLLGPRLGEDLDDHVVGDQVLFHELADEVEVGLGRGREAHLDLLEAAADQQVEHLALPLRVHGIDQGLVAVAQVHAAPARRARDHAGRPRPIGQRDRRERTVVLERHRSRWTCLARH